jgi:ribosomal-protein-alanine N-acetyltransferase
MKLIIDSSYFISDFIEVDKEALIKHLNEKKIYDQTLRIPFPYTDAEASSWIKHVVEETQKFGRSVSWAIRRDDGFLIGGIGIDDFEPEKSHRAMFGYWLAKPYWNQGIMSKAVKIVSDFALSELNLIRLAAFVFDLNLASARVLEKAGFQREGLLRRYFIKDGKPIDVFIYSRLSHLVQEPHK